MTSRRAPPADREIVTLATQDERDRICMVIMQLDMALALANSKGLKEVAAHLKAALDEACNLRDKMLN
jgi:hypothetical protein